MKKPKYVVSVFIKTDHVLSAKEKRNIRTWIKCSLKVSGPTEVRRVSELSSADAYKF